MLWQSFLVFTVIFAFMYVIKHTLNADQSLGAIGATSLGSSAFLAFVAHDTAMARERRMIFGYGCGIIIGVLGSCLLQLLNKHALATHAADLQVLDIALVAMVTMLLMMIFSCQHPPAVGIAIGLVLRHWDMPILIIVFTTVLVIALIKSILRPWLLNLL